MIISILLFRRIRVKNQTDKEKRFLLPLPDSDSNPSVAQVLATVVYAVNLLSVECAVVVDVDVDDLCSR